MATVKLRIGSRPSVKVKVIPTFPTSVSGENGITVTKESGAYVIGTDGVLAALTAYNTEGLLTHTAADTFTGRTITGTSAQITVTYGDGVAGNPTISLPSTVNIPGIVTADAPASNPSNGIDTFSFRALGAFGGGYGLTDGTFNAGLYTTTSPGNALLIGFGSSLGALTTKFQFTDTDFSPATSDAAALGTSSLAWSDAFFANGAVLTFNNTNTISHSASTGAFSFSSSCSINTANNTACLTAVNTATPGSGTGSGMNLRSGGYPTATGHRLGFLAFGSTNGTTNISSCGVYAFASEAYTAGSNQGSYFQFETTSAASASRVARLTIADGIQIGAPTGGDKGAGTLNAAGDIYKNNTAYTNPDYAFEHYYTGKIERFAENEGAASYCGLMPLDELRDYTRKNLRLPGINDEGIGIFARSDLILEKLEEMTLHVLDLHERVKRLEPAH